MVGFHRRDGILHADELALSALAERWGTPLYVYSASLLRARYRTFEEAFAHLDPLIAYAVKANANLALLRLIRALGAGADIVSEGELHRALLAGFAPETVVFSGVGKTHDELARALDAAIYACNAESEQELALIVRLAHDRRVRPLVGLRVNPMFEPRTAHAYTRTAGEASKFGVPWPEARDLFRRFGGHRGIRLAGLHVHLGSQILDLEAFDDTFARLAEWIETLCADGIELEYLDIGGGLGVAYREDEQDPDPRALAALVQRHLGDRGRRWRLVVEPGRYLVAPAGVLLTRVLYVKQSGPRKFVVTDAGMTELLRPSHYESYHRIEPVEWLDRPPELVDVVGPVCESGDFLGRARLLPGVAPGDLLAVLTVGAYGFVMSSNYNQRRRPAEVLVEGRCARLIRRRETLDDLVAAERDEEV